MTATAGSFLAQVDFARASSDALAFVVEIARQAAAAIEGWVAQGVAVAPALMMGLAILLVVPPLVVFGWIIASWQLRSDRRARALPRQRFGASEGRGPGGGPAWLASAGGTREVLSAERPLVRIGRQDDNDICLDTATVHRYHAIVHRDEDADYWVVDVSGPGGNGIMVNGARTAKARLLGGEEIMVGAARLTFETMKPAS